MTYLLRERDLQIERFRNGQEPYLSLALLVERSGKAKNEIQDIKSFLRERVGNDFLIFADLAVMQRSLDTVVERKADELSNVGYTDAGVS